MTVAQSFKFCESDLFALRDELYEGSWELFLSDLQNRLVRNRCCNHINKRIKRDIEAITKLMQE